MRLFASCIVFSTLTFSLFGQQPAPNHSVPIYHVTVVQRSLQAVNFSGTAGLP